MHGFGFIASAVLIILLLPIVVATWEQKRVSDGFYLAIAAGGVGFAVLRGGLLSGLIAAATGLACLLLITTLVAAVRARWHVRPLVGGHIKLLGAGAIWLGASGALAMLIIASFLFVFLAFTLSVRNKSNTRPEFAPIAALVILLLQVQHSIITIF